MNLVYINTHDTGRALSPYGYNVKTDNLLSLAKDGVLFSNAYCCGPTCSPSRASMLTGTYPHQNGMYGLAQRGFELNDPSKHLANYLKNNGYHTVISGIQHEVGWYLDVDEKKLNELGYQEVLTHSSAPYNDDKSMLYKWDEENAIEVCNWLDNYKGEKPFLLTYGMHSTHRPYPIVDNEYVDPNYVSVHQPLVNNDINRNDEAQFLTTACYADKNVGRIIDSLKKNGLYDNSIIIYTTDHGVPIPFNKCFLTDKGIGVSLIMRIPDSKTKGIVVDNLVSQLDVFPTICDLLHLEKPKYLEGKSFAKMIENPKEKTRDYIFAEVNFHTSYEPCRCIRNERFKYIKYYDEEWNKINLSNLDNCPPKQFLLENGLEDIIKDKEALYDTYYDPNETNNLINNPLYADVLAELKAKMNEIQVETNDPILKEGFPLKKEYKVNKRSCLNPSSKDPEDYDSLGV